MPLSDLLHLIILIKNEFSIFNHIVLTKELWADLTLFWFDCQMKTFCC